ncbi:MAG: glycosyltransferase family 9 protein [Bacteroidota bacterium]|nr:glycosyltransferase family 9 protein [Bacteroidota bacterium]MDP4249361.1 glycosyltransferase family 9 protein [Bacteroidota bacterium]
MKVLIIRFSSIGDIVLTTPVVRCLKQQMPNAEIHFLAKSTYLQILASNPYIDKIHYLEQSLQAVIRELQLEKFDLIVDLHHNLRSMKVKDALKVKSVSYNKLNIQKWIYTSFKWNLLPKTHIVDRYMETVKSFGVENDGAGLDYFIAREDVINETDLPTSHSAGYVGVVIGAALNTKKYPFHHLKKLCELLDHPIVLLGGLEDADEGDRIAAADHIKIYNACGKFGLNESADLVRRAKLVVTNDTGLMHIAAAYKRPIISLWGNTVPDFGMSPYYGTNYLARFAENAAPGASPYEILEIQKLRCRPCSKIGYDSCPLGHFKCMEKIDPAYVVERIKARLLAAI